MRLDPSERTSHAVAKLACPHVQELLLLQLNSSTRSTKLLRTANLEVSTQDAAVADPTPLSIETESQLDILDSQLAPLFAAAKKSLIALREEMPMKVIDSTPSLLQRDIVIPQWEESADAAVICANIKNSRLKTKTVTSSTILPKNTMVAVMKSAQWLTNIILNSPHKMMMKMLSSWLVATSSICRCMNPIIAVLEEFERPKQ